MGKYSESFRGFDVAKKKHAIAIAEGGRTGEVRFLGMLEQPVADRANDQEIGGPIPSAACLL